MTAILERVASAAGRVDREAGVIRGVKILGRVSSNGYEYSDKALDDAAELSEGARVYINHSLRDEPGNRGLMDEFGVLKNVHRNGNGVYGDLHYLKTHPAAEFILERAERFPDKIGLSHHVDARMVRRGAKDVVETIARVYSVDIVSNPATNKGLYESRRGQSEYPATVEEFAAALNGRSSGRSLAEAMNNPNAPPTTGEITATQSADVDSAVVATLGELLPAETVTQLRKLASNALARTYESAVVVVTRSADTAPDGTNIETTLAKLLEEKARAMAALDAILKPLDWQDRLDAEEDAERQRLGLPPLDEPDAATIESLNRRLDAIARDQQQIRESRVTRPAARPAVAHFREHAPAGEPTYDELKRQSAGNPREFARALRCG